MKAINPLLIGLVCLLSVSAVAQKMVPHSFRYQADTSDRDTSGRNQLRFLTQVTQPNTAFLRLYFKGTQLGEGSYLVLEGTDGSRQELRQQDLENWHYSSAYFNGQSVNISLFAAAGEKITVRVSELKITDEQAGPVRNARQAAGTLGTPTPTLSSISANLTETYPYAKAVGRFTNGSISGSTGWIAPNGAIVASDDAYNDHENSYDVIEFNVPPSVGTTVLHPSPQDQYPLLIRALPHSDQLFFKKDGTISAGGGNGWVIFDPQPNGTGLRPGERQQEYFRIATNPRNSTINEQGDGNMLVDIFHYGETGSDYLVGSTTYRTLRLAQTHLLPQNSYLTLDRNGDRDRFVLYNLPSWGITDAGAPVTFAGTNVAIGVHSEGNNLNLGHGRGFRDDVLRNELNDFYASNSVYVDFDGPPSGATGEIHKPYLSAQEAAGNAPSGAQVYIARNTYLGPVTFNRPMTLRAPVGKVTLGANQVAARKAAGPTIPQHWLDEEPLSSFDRESAEVRRVQAFPNPFKEQTEIKYPFAEGGPISVHIFNMAGVPVAAFTHAASGQTGVQWNGTDRTGTPVPAGLYLVQVNYGNQTFTTKVLKN